MSREIPTEVPTTITAGETAEWKITLADYPADEGWTLSYAFLRYDSGMPITFDAGASDSDHLVSVGKDITQTWLPGDYNGQAFIASATERFKVWEGKLTVNPDYVLSGGQDTRTIARKTLDAFDAAILAVAKAQSSGRSGSISEWTVEGLHIKRTSPELLLQALQQQRDRYATIVKIEEAKVLRADGKRTGSRILTRFVQP